jgi:ferredoxin-thioredoxin reductase catalytic subunit
MISTKLNPKEGWMINPDANVVRGILNGLERTGGECPCVNDSEELICPCSNYRNKDKCCCNLYVKIC